MTEASLLFPAGELAPELQEVLAVSKGWDGYGPEAVYFDTIGQFGFMELMPSTDSGCGADDAAILETVD
ncbi:hypothetical protein [Hymenobacter lapidiphilus]|uniref:Uncharacterized protein n=1 Tax=Hymenobacter lapidiphilus TaxID=2608003 RepID=A0A7Y7PQF1_9BACT|nr:hypothetical protein [Hymenobacter lapidiphilus]NVO31985.1 hypothetical protein [Hymenobacter lapidiphilus]